MYGESNANIDDANVIYTLEPGIYEKGFITKVYKDEVGSDDSDKKPVLVFLFRSNDGKKHQRTEWEQTDSTKVNNQLARIGSYARQIKPDFQLKEFTSWDDVRDYFVEQLNNEKCSKTPVDFKIVANVYNASKPKSDLPNYKGAVVASSKGIILKMSSSELSDLKVYNQIKSGNYNPAGGLLDSGNDLIQDDQILGNSPNPEDIF